MNKKSRIVAKRSYQIPKLKKVGSLRKLTLDVGSGAADGGNKQILP